MEKMMNNFVEATEEPTIEQLKEFENISEELEDVEEENSNCDDSVKQFLRDIGGIPMLTREEENRLAKMIQEGGENAKEACDKLATANLRLVFYHAKKYVDRGLDFEDLIGFGNEGLLKAAAKFDYTKGAKFSTYASFWIKEAISRGLLNHRNTIRVPAYLGDVSNKVRSVQAKLQSEFGCAPTIEDIADYAGIPLPRVKAALNTKCKVISFEQKFSEEKDGTIEDTISDENALDPCEEALRAELKEAVSEVLQRLEPREATVLKLRFGIGVDRCYTLEEIGDMPEMSITRERVRQIEKKAIAKIRRSKSMRNSLVEYAS